MLKTIVTLTAPASYCEPGLKIINDSWYGVVNFYMVKKAFSEKEGFVKN